MSEERQYKFEDFKNGDSLLQVFRRAVDQRFGRRKLAWEENLPCQVTAAECLSVVAEVEGQ